MEELEFSEIHDVVRDTFEKDSITSEIKKLEVIGKWYFRFLTSQEENLNLILPAFNLYFAKTALRYLKLFTLTFNLCNKEQLKGFEGTCLLDVFKYKPTINEINIEEYILMFSELKEGIIVWSNDTYTNNNSFLPVFKRNQLKSTQELTSIYYTFPLFKSIREHQLINYPVLLDLEKDINLVFDPFKNDTKKEKSYHFYNELNIQLAKILNDENAAKLEAEYEEKNIKNRINIKFPYSKKPHLFLTSLGVKRLNLEFNSRFYYKELEKNDLILLPEELNHPSNNLDLSVLDYQIVDTNHNIRLFELLDTFKEDWKNLELNKFIAPFPKYWLLFINQSSPKEEWIKQFKLSYPTIAHEPIMRTSEEIISELHNLNWILKTAKNFSNPILIFPELKGLRSKRLDWAFNNFKNYLNTIIPTLKVMPPPHSRFEFNDDYEYIYLNSFDVIGLSNNRISKNSCKVLTPDFMYFGYEHWIRYHILKYKSSALIEGKRRSLDMKYVNNLALIELTQKEIIDSIKNDIKNYRSKYEEKEFEEEPSELNTTDSEDLDLTSSEEINIPNSNNRENQEIKVITTDGEEIIFRSNETVLVQRDFIRSAPAKVLQKGDFFIDIPSFAEIINDDDFISKLSQQPDRTKDYQSELYSKGENIYEALKNRGLSISSRDYFKKKYLIPKEDISDATHIIPLRKKDWKIICEVLIIDDNERDLAFIAYYGRSKQNRLKELYKLVLNLYTENNNLQSSENPEFLKKVENIVQKYDDIFPKNNDFNLSDITEAITSNVKYSIVFKEIRELTVL